jgi:hypothetical protein
MLDCLPDDSQDHGTKVYEKIYNFNNINTYRGKKNRNRNKIRSNAINSACFSAKYGNKLAGINTITF